MQFKDVIGQELAIDRFIRLADAQRLPHALMVVANEGQGGLPFALACVQYLFCKNKIENDSCGKCVNCIRIHKLSHPDFHLSFPIFGPKSSGKSLCSFYLPEFREFVNQTPYATTYSWLQFINAENKQGNISVDECREIIDHLNLMSAEGGYKVQLIWRPEYLGKEGNTLLKLIEEPPADTIIILVAEQTQLILNTILSRVQNIHLTAISTSEIALALEKKEGVENRRAVQIAHLAAGNYAEALQLLQYTGNDLLEPTKNWFNGIFGNRGMLIYQWVEDMSSNGREQQKNALAYVQQLLGHALRKKMIPEYRPALLDDEFDFITKLSQSKLSTEAFQKISEAISTTIANIERNANSKIQLLNLSIQLQYLIKNKELTIL